MIQNVELYGSGVYTLLTYTAELRRWWRKVRLRPILHRGTRRFAGATGTAEKPAADLYSVSDHFAAAVLTNRSDRMDRTFEAIEGVASASRDDLKSLVIIISADFTTRH